MPYQGDVVQVQVDAALRDVDVALVRDAGATAVIGSGAVRFSEPALTHLLAGHSPS